MVDHDGDFRERHLRHADFLGAFALLESAAGVLMVQNRRVVGGVAVRTWDLPGGQVEPGEDLRGALRRELQEEVRVAPVGAMDFLFVQEGRRVRPGGSHMWRSFFFSVPEWQGEPQAGAEILDTAWVARTDLPGLLTAPYHDSFRSWLADGGRFFASEWRD